MVRSERPRHPTPHEIDTKALTLVYFDAGLGGWFYQIKSKLNALMIGIKDATKGSGAQLEMVKPNSNDDNQLWAMWSVPETEYSNEYRQWQGYDVIQITCKVNFSTSNPAPAAS
jgi:hypothetical protein